MKQFSSTFTILIVIWGYPQTLGNDEVSLTENQLMAQSDYVIPQKTPSAVAYYLEGSRVTAFTELGPQILNHLFDPTDLMIQSEEFLLTGPRFATHEITVFRGGKTEKEIPLKKILPIWTADYREGNLFLGSFQNARLKLMTVNNSGEITAQSEHTYTEISKGNTRGKLFSVLLEDTWVVWSPKSHELFFFDLNLQLKKRIQTELTETILNYQPKVFSTMRHLQTQDSSKALADYCAQMKGRPTNLIPIGIFQSEGHISVCYKLSILFGCLKGNFLESHLRTDILTLDADTGDMLNVQKVQRYYVSGLFKSRKTLIGRKFIKDEKGGGKWLYEAFPTTLSSNPKN